MESNINKLASRIFNIIKDMPEFMDEELFINLTDENKELKEENKELFNKIEKITKRKKYNESQYLDVFLILKKRINKLKERDYLLIYEYEELIKTNDDATNEIQLLNNEISLLKKSNNELLANIDSIIKSNECKKLELLITELYKNTDEKVKVINNLNKEIQLLTDKNKILNEENELNKLVNFELKNKFDQLNQLNQLNQLTINNKISEIINSTDKESILLDDNTSIESLVNIVNNTNNTNNTNNDADETDKLFGIIKKRYGTNNKTLGFFDKLINEVNNEVINESNNKVINESNNKVINNPIIRSINNTKNIFIKEPDIKIQNIQPNNNNIKGGGGGVNNKINNRYQLHEIEDVLKLCINNEYTTLTDQDILKSDIQLIKKAYNRKNVRHYRNKI